MLTIKRIVDWLISLSPVPTPDRHAVLALLPKLPPAVDSEIGKAMRPIRPVRHQVKVVRLDWWLAEYAPDHKRTA